jgi:hypothetical protein
VHADRQIITHSFESIAFDDQGVLHTSWVDKRDLTLALSESAAAPVNASGKAGNKTSYRGAAIYRNESRDGGATFGADIKLADHSCECCRIAMTPGVDGQLRVLWRQVFEPNVRDHAFASLAAGSANTPPVRATQDDWRIDACPHHGPGLALAPDKGFHAVWFGIRKVDGHDQAAVRYGQLNANGTPRLDTVRPLPDARAEHADVLADGDKVAIVWRSVDATGSQLRGWLSSDGGQTFALTEIASTTLANDQPRLARQGHRMVAVWRNAQEVQVHELHP